MYNILPTRRSKRILGRIVCVCMCGCVSVYLEDAGNTSANDNPMRGSWQMGKKLTRETFSSIGRCKQNKQKKLYIYICVCMQLYMNISIRKV